jgi:hypothetical protein
LEADGGNGSSGLASLQSLADEAADALHEAAAEAAMGSRRATQKGSEAAQAERARLEGLLSALGVVSPEAAVQQQQIMSERLQRLDQVGLGVVCVVGGGGAPGV